MKDSTKKSQWVLRLCEDCQRTTHYWRFKEQEQTFKCMECGREEVLPPADHDRDGLIE
jgi:ribosomal protein S27E